MAPSWTKRALDESVQESGAAGTSGASSERPKKETRTGKGGKGGKSRENKEAAEDQEMMDIKGDEEEDSTIIELMTKLLPNTTQRMRETEAAVMSVWQMDE